MARRGRGEGLAMSTAAERKAELVAAGEVAESLTDRLLNGILVEFIGLRDDLARREDRRMKAGGTSGRGAASGGSQATTGGTGARLPNYGRKAGEPIAGAALADLEYYAAGCVRSLNDPGKSRYHATERTRLAAIEAEIARQKGPQPASDGDVWDDAQPADGDDVPF